MIQSEEFRDGYGFMEKCLDLMGKKRKGDLNDYLEAAGGDGLRSRCEVDFFNGAFAWRVLWMVYLMRRREL